MRFFIRVYGGLKEDEMEKKQCVNCGWKNNLTVDHIIPKSKGGLNVKRNKQILCRLCNQIKGATEIKLIEYPSVKKIIQKWNETIKVRNVFHVGYDDSFLFKKYIEFQNKNNLLLDSIEIEDKKIGIVMNVFGDIQVFT